MPKIAQCHQTVLQSLESSKAENIISIDLLQRSSIADYMVIASGRSQRHVSAIADHLIDDLKDVSIKNIRIEGLESCDWVLLDIGDIVVHLFRPEIRDFYNIEKIWQEHENQAVLPSIKRVL